jgi:ketosteroid isomerase-like protein
MTITTDELVAREEIRDVLFRYTRGIDRLDLDLVRSCYHVDAHDDHGAFRGDVDGFLDWVGEALSYFDSTMHFIGNQLIDVDGDVAHTESYCVAYHRRGPRDGEVPHDLVTALRYVDRLERRADGRWRIADRVCVFDWSRRDPVVDQWAMDGAVRGRRGPDDPVWHR